MQASLAGAKKQWDYSWQRKEQKEQTENMVVGFETCRGPTGGLLSDQYRFIMKQKIKMSTPGIRFCALKHVD